MDYLLKESLEVAAKPCQSNMLTIGFVGKLLKNFSTVIFLPDYASTT